MTELTPLGLPLLAAGQAQKHVTHNEAVVLVDALLAGAVADKDLSAPPASPPEGARYIVGPAPSGAWAGRAGAVAFRDAGTWRFLPPRAGFLVHVADEGVPYLHDGAGWGPLSERLRTLGQLARLGIGTEADAANPFAAKLNKALWTARTVAEGGDGDLRYTLNKQAAANVLSLLFQTGFSGRCEIGLVGNDALAIRVSADGASWTTALEIAAGGGSVAPGTNGTVALGGPARRWSTVYAATGTINTSDAREKSPVEPLSPAELAAAADLARAVGTFRFLSAVAAKGEGARRHAGLTVQAAIAILERHGLSPFAYGFICADEDALSFRTGELLLFIARGLEARLAALEARATA